ncbi:TetR/AcrR family transcriptional regulator [Bradyrhizobium cajani]|uniref:TetR family transcriptional regulator n=1 Tax=Bradyrhizobium cajani TaxID=1928661 RepID=A0A844TFD7_9BRAD|nr:TetR/AcrR family transcriptional regulator [Bradyrhizobium cajani]MCP3369854.1 TetR/AcrR family transcriptional regulator [Bradyrhizobium cajani]MVT77867.1 TetR family transcriptional regulator [Bradyrhizobium cajani]
MSPKIEPREDDAEGHEVRKRILGAALSAFMEGGYAQTSTLEIATRARVSKRELYSLFGNKEAMLVACITERAERIKAPTDLPALRDREMLAKVLTAFGTKLLTETTDPVVVAVFRLAISEAVHAPKVAHALDSIARKPIRESLRTIMTNARSTGLLAGEPDAMTETFLGLLWGDLMTGLLLQATNRPSTGEIARRAGEASTAFLRLYPKPG